MPEQGDDRSFMFAHFDYLLCLCRCSLWFTSNAAPWAYLSATVQRSPRKWYGYGQGVDKGKGMGVVSEEDAARAIGHFLSSPRGM
jgi:hypothetical protein